jgi:hypothetical protein
VFRYTTVELLVDKTPSRPRTDRMVRVKIDYNEAPLRRVVRAAGATWDPDSRLWNMSRRVAGVLNLLDRIVEN